MLTTEGFALTWFFGFTPARLAELNAEESEGPVPAPEASPVDRPVAAGALR